MLEPSYGEGVGEALDEIEADDQSAPLWNSIVEVLNMICDHPESPQARRYALRSPGGSTVWSVPVPAPKEDRNWVIHWAPDGGDAAITYVGPWPPIS